MSVSNLRPLRGRTLAVLAAVAVLSGGVTKALVNTGSGGGGGGGGSVTWTTANLWVDSSGGSCSRQASVGAYSDAGACSSLNAALTAASAGDRIVVKCGAYGDQALTATAKASAVSFYAETYDQATSAEDVVSATTCATVTDLQIDTDKVHITGIQAANANVHQTHAIEELHIESGSSTWSDVLLSGWHGHQSYLGANHVTIDYSAFGNTDFCGTGYDHDDDAMQIIEGSGGNTNNLTIKHTVFHDWTGNPDGECGIGDGHNDCMQTDGGNNVTWDADLFYNCPTSNMQLGEFGAQTVGTWTITNSFFGATQCCNSFSWSGPVHCSGTTFRNNIEIAPGNMMNDSQCSTGTVTYTDNVFIGSVDACSAGSIDHNTFDPSLGVTCGTNSQRCTPSWTNGTPTGLVAWSPELNSGDTCIKGFTNATFPSTDFFGNARPNGTADSGPVEIG